MKLLAWGFDMIWAVKVVEIIVALQPKAESPAFLDHVHHLLQSYLLAASENVSPSTPQGDDGWNERKGNDHLSWTDVATKGPIRILGIGSQLQ
ncbi:hypothetical protein ACH5RR_027646 [Cinchona calisaya]|uniref:Uncharacterized protein n=1 Tax=Cinchona calisaya TaxID=153742 RepID=A0ABD2YQ25_9GENT